MNTQLTVEQIQVALRNSGIWNKRQDVFVPNVSYGLLGYEADLIIMSKTGYLTEIEIKRSWVDFMADFKKDHKHNDSKICYFYYCLPISLKDRVMSFWQREYGGDTTNNHPATLFYLENGRIERGGGWPSKGGRKLFIEEQLQLVRLGCFRYWNLQEKWNNEFNPYA